MLTHNRKELNRKVPKPNPLPAEPHYSFKCHRQPLDSRKYNADGVPKEQADKFITGNDPKPSSSQRPQHVYSVNVIEFNQSAGTFVSAGGDGGMTFWDGLKRSKLKGT